MRTSTAITGRSRQSQKAGILKVGMVMDFKLIRNKLNNILEKLDHKYLNKIKPFDKTNPTSENIARFIYETLKPKLAGLKSITVWENPTSCATYYE